MGPLRGWVKKLLLGRALPLVCACPVAAGTSPLTRWLTTTHPYLFTSRSACRESERDPKGAPIQVSAQLLSSWGRRGEGLRPGLSGSWWPPRSSGLSRAGPHHSGLGLRLYIPSPVGCPLVTMLTPHLHARRPGPHVGKTPLARQGDTPVGSGAADGHVWGHAAHHSPDPAFAILTFW